MVIVLLVVGALVGAGIVGGVWWMSAREASPGTGSVVLDVEPGPAGDEQLVRGALEPAVRQLNSDLRLSHDLRVRVVGTDTATEVGAAGPQYDPQARTIYIPWDYVEHARERLEEAGARAELSEPVDQILARAMTFVLFHETAHAVIDLVDVPSTGGEEADADSLGVLLALASGPDGAAIPLAARELFDIQAQESQDATDQVAAGYDTPQERSFDLQCLVYGSDPTVHADLVGFEGKIPALQAPICAYDYQREVRSWQRLLGSRLRHIDGLVLPDA